FRVPASARLHDLRVLTLILVGESDIPDVAAYAGAIELGIVGSLREVVADAGHLIQLERPAWLVERIAAFIDQHPVGPAPDSILQRYAGTCPGLLDGVDPLLRFRDGRLFLEVLTEPDAPLWPVSAERLYSQQYGGITFTFHAVGDAIEVEALQNGT